MPWYKKMIRSGILLEERHYFATRDGRAVSREPHSEESSDSQQDANQRNAEMELTRLIACNFGGAKGGASYVFTSGEDITEEEAMKRERNLLDRIKRARAKAGLPKLKYIAVTEKQRKWHHHIIMQDDMPVGQLQEIWEQGRPTKGTSVYARAISEDAESYGQIARYVLGVEKDSRAGEKNVKPLRRKWQRRWHASKGLERPKVEKREVKRPPRVGIPKPPKGYRLLNGWQIGADALGNVYTYFAAVREETNDVVQRSRKAAKRPKGSGACPGGSEGRAL